MQTNSFFNVSCHVLLALPISLSLFSGLHNQTSYETSSKVLTDSFWFC